MKCTENVEITEGTILNIDLTRDGKIIFKVRRDEGGPFETISEKELQDAVVEKGSRIEGELLFSDVLSLTGLKKNPIKVYVDTGYGVMCFLIDERTGRYLGRC